MFCCNSFTTALRDPDPAIGKRRDHVLRTAQPVERLVRQPVGLDRPDVADPPATGRPTPVLHAGARRSAERLGTGQREAISEARVSAVGPTTTWTTRPERTTPKAPAARNASSSTFAWSVTSTRRRVIQGSRAVMFSRPPRPATMSDAVLMATPFSVPVLSQFPSVMRSGGRLKSFVVTITLSHLHAVRGEGARSRYGEDATGQRGARGLRTRRHSHRAPPRFTRFPHVTLWERDRSLDDAAEEIVIPLAETSHSGRSQGTMSDDPFRLR